MDFQNHSLRISQLNSDTPTFAEFSATWFSEAEVSWCDSHKDNVALTLRKYLCPTFGDMPLDQIIKAQLLANINPRLLRNSAGRILSTVIMTAQPGDHIGVRPMN